LFAKSLNTPTAPVGGTEVARPNSKS
jgi:hypothetical protein